MTPGTAARRSTGSTRRWGEHLSMIHRYYKSQYHSPPRPWCRCPPASTGRCPAASRSACCASGRYTTGAGQQRQRPRLLGEHRQEMGLLLIIFFQISRQSDHQPALTTRYKIGHVSNEMKSAVTELCMSKSFLLAVAKYNFDLTSTKHTVIPCLIVSIQQMGREGCRYLCEEQYKHH